VISSTGQINVDFADVCTVMRNGGVAILGNASAHGENRAQKAIEEALNSPLLNDNDIRGAKWILININSSEGEHEFTMDEVEIIQNHLLSQAGEHTDVIMGLGYDNSLGANLGITLIATGFEHKDPFTKAMETRSVPKKEEKIVMTLGQPEEEQKSEIRPVLTTAKGPSVEEQPVHAPLPEDLLPKLVDLDPAPPAADQPADVSPFLSDVDKPVEKNEQAPRIEWVLSPEPTPAPRENNISEPPVRAKVSNANGGMNTGNSSPASAAAGGYLARPSNIYAEEPRAEKQSNPSAAEGFPKAMPEHNTPLKEPILNTNAPDPSGEDENSPEMQLVFRDNGPAADEPGAYQTHSHSVPNSPAEEPAAQDDTDDPKRRAAERINKLRNLSFNINAADPNNEFETVPAYIRRNLELYNTISNVENFYSNYEVKTDENNNTEISTINTFLDGKRPD
jgi:cell division protein FtsZ